jgi:hypothetical protein
MLDDKPLSQWKQEGAFDSSYSASKEYAQAKDVQTLQLANLSMMTEASHASVLAYAAARCVRSDAP